MLPEILFEKMNHQRNLRNFLSIEQTLDLAQDGNIIPDPFSVLISKNAVIGSNNLFYPNVIIESPDGLSSIQIGNQNLFYPQSFVLADQGGSIVIGNANHFEGGVSIKANVAGSSIRFGNQGRYLNGVQVIGKCSLGSGSQILGNITVQNCTLAEGEPFSYPDPDRRAGLLKGFGLARNLTIEKGQVIDGAGKFDPSNIQYQSFFHPQKTNPGS